MEQDTQLRCNSRHLRLGGLFDINENSLLLFELVAKSDSLSISDIQLHLNWNARWIRGIVNRYVESGLLRNTTEGARNRRFQINWDNEIASWIFQEYKPRRKKMRTRDQLAQIDGFIRSQPSMKCSRKYLGEEMRKHDISNSRLSQLLRILQEKTVEGLDGFVFHNKLDRESLIVRIY